MTGNGHNDIEFRLVDLEHAEFCIKSTIHETQENGNFIVQINMSLLHTCLSLSMLYVACIAYMYIGVLV